MAGVKREDIVPALGGQNRTTGHERHDCRAGCPERAEVAYWRTEPDQAMAGERALGILEPKGETGEPGYHIQQSDQESLASVS